MANVTNIPAPRVPFLDERTGLMSREWYRFFLNLFMLTGGGTTDVSLVDLQVSPDAKDYSGDIDEAFYQSQLATLTARYAELQDQIDGSYVNPTFVQDTRAERYNRVLTWLSIAR